MANLLSYNKSKVYKTREHFPYKHFFNGFLNKGSTRLFITIHGNDMINKTNEVFQLDELNDNYEKKKEKIQKIITCKVPKNVYIIEKTLLNNVVYGDSKDDLENMIFQSHPKWFFTDFTDNDSSCYNANLNKLGHDKFDLKNFNVSVTYNDKLGEEVINKNLKQETSDMLGRKKILHTSQIYKPGDYMINKEVSWDEDKAFNIFNLSQPPTKQEQKNKPLREYYTEKFFTEKLLPQGTDFKTFKEKYPPVCFNCRELKKQMFFIDSSKMKIVKKDENYMKDMYPEKIIKDTDSLVAELHYALKEQGISLCIDCISNFVNNDSLIFTLEGVKNIHDIYTDLPLDDEMYKITNNVITSEPYSYQYSDEQLKSMTAISDLKWYHRNNFVSTEFPMLYYLLNDEEYVYFMNVYDKLNKKMIQNYNNNNNYNKINTLDKLIKALVKVAKPTQENPLIINFSHCSPPFSQDSVYFTERYIRNHKRNADNLMNDVYDKLDKLEEEGRKLESKKTGPKSYKKRRIDELKKINKEMESESNKIVSFNNAYKNKELNKSKLHIDIELYKHSIFLKGRENFCKLRKLKNNDNLKTLLSNYNDLHLADLPRVKRNIVMMGNDERRVWYKNVFGGYFQQLKNHPNPIKQEGLDMLYFYALHDVYDRTLVKLAHQYRNIPQNLKDAYSLVWGKGDWIPLNNIIKLKEQTLQITAGGKRKTRKHKKIRKSKKKRKGRRKTKRKKKRRTRKKY